MRWFGTFFRPPSLVRALATTGLLVGASVLSTIGLVVAAAHSLDRSTSPLVAATEVRHAAMIANALESEAREMSSEDLPRHEVRINAAQDVVHRELEELKDCVNAFHHDEAPSAERLIPLWEERCRLARHLIHLHASAAPGEFDSPAYRAELERVRGATRVFTDAVQSVVAHLDVVARESVLTLELAALGTSGIALGLLAVGALFARRQVLVPLRRLAGAEASVASGRLDVRVETSGVSEVRELALGFNEMVASLRARAREVKEKQELISRRESALDRRNRALAAANAELDAFAYAASHDLRAPLRGIENMARFLTEDVGQKLDVEALDKLERIRRAARRLHHLIDSLLEVARAGRELGPLEPVALDDAAAAALESLDAQVRDTGAVVTIGPDLPVVLGDRTRLTQVFQNLLANAIKYSAGPGRTPHVEVGGRLVGEGGAAEFWVQDDGIGIDESQHRRIFQLFRRLHRETDYEGTGVGLSIVQRAVQAHGGAIDVQSSLGHGARFTVRLPVQAAQALRQEAA